MHGPDDDARHCQIPAVAVIRVPTLGTTGPIALASPKSRSLAVGGTEFFPPRNEENVPRLQIAMHDARAMGACPAHQRSERRVETPSSIGSGPLCQSSRQRLSFQEFHDQEVDAVLSTSVVQRADVRMVQGGDDARLSLEAFARVGIVGDTQAGMTLIATVRFSRVSRRPVDLAHPARSDPRLDVVRAQLLTLEVPVHHVAQDGRCLEK